MDEIHETPPATSAPPPPPQPSQVDMQNPAAVSQAAVVTMWTSDTTKDPDANAAVVRAAPYLSDELVTAARDASEVRPSQDWIELADHRGRTVVTAVPADEAGKPVNNQLAAYQTWQLTVDRVGADGWRGTPQTLTVFVTLARPAAGQPWRVTEYELG
jgi:hypothetical protein